MRVASSSLLLFLLQGSLLALCLSAGAEVSAADPPAAYAASPLSTIATVPIPSAPAQELDARSRMVGNVFDKIKLNKHKLVSSPTKPKKGHSKKPKAGHLGSGSVPTPPSPAPVSLSSPYPYNAQLSRRGGAFPVTSSHYWSGRPSISSTLGTLSSKLTSKINAAKPRPGSSVPGAGGFGPTHSRYGAHFLTSKIKGVGRGRKRSAKRIKGFRPLGGARRLRGYGFI